MTEAADKLRGEAQRVLDLRAKLLLQSEKHRNTPVAERDPDDVKKWWATMRDLQLANIAMTRGDIAERVLAALGGPVVDVPRFECIRCHGALTDGMCSRQTCVELLRVERVGGPQRVTPGLLDALGVTSGDVPRARLLRDAGWPATLVGPALGHCRSWWTVRARQLGEDALAAPRDASEIVSVPCTTEQKGRWQRMAKEANVTLAGYVRHRMDHGA